LFIAKGLLTSLKPVGELGHDLGPEEAQILEAFVGHRGELHKLLSKRFVGPSPKTKVMANKRQASVTLNVTGRTAALSLIPVGVGAGFWLMMGSEEPTLAVPPEAPPRPSEPVPMAPAPTP